MEVEWPSKSKHQTFCFSDFPHLSENGKKKMAVETGVSVCKHFQYGYCKYKMTCKKKHVTTVCDDKMCNQKGCEKRHPRKCKYVIKYNMEAVNLALSVLTLMKTKTIKGKMKG